MGLLLGCSSGQGPHLGMTGEPLGFSLVAVAESRRSTHMSEETAGNLRPQASDRTAVALVLSGLPSAPSLLPTPNHGPRRLLASLGPSLREPAVVQRAPRDQCPQSRAGPLKVHDCLH